MVGGGSQSVERTGPGAARERRLSHNLRLVAWALPGHPGPVPGTPAVRTRATVARNVGSTGSGSWATPARYGRANDLSPGR